MELRGSGLKIYYFLQLKITQGAGLNKGYENFKGTLKVSKCQLLINKIIQS